MTLPRFGEEQIGAVLQEQQRDDVCRRHGISTATFYIFKAKRGGLEQFRLIRCITRDFSRQAELWRDFVGFIQGTGIKLPLMFNQRRIRSQTTELEAVT
jgi:hypothetical protein